MREKQPQNSEKIDKKRREVWKGILSTAGTAIMSTVLGTTGEAIAHPISREVRIPEKFKEIYNYLEGFYSNLETRKEVEEAGPWVPTKLFKIEEIPEPDAQKVLNALGKDSALIIIKKLNAFILIYTDEGSGEIKTRKGPVGTGKESKGYYTPEGIYPVHRKEGPNYKARALETRGADMGYAVFFNRGIAFHRSENYRAIGGELYLHRDNSHGCANGTEVDAIFVHEYMQKGEYVIVLP